MRKILSVMVVIAMIFWQSGAAFAANGADTWVGGVSPSLDAANWSGTNTTPLSGDSWIFTAANGQGSNTLSDNYASFNLAGVTFNSGSLAYTINGSTPTNVLNFTGNIANNSSANQAFGNMEIEGTINNTGTGSGSVTLGGAIQSSVTSITEDSASSALDITGGITVGSTTTLTDSITGGQLNVSTDGITGTGNLVLANDTNTASGIDISSTVNNSGTITNSGTGNGSVEIIGGVGSNVTGIIEDSTGGSTLNIATDALSVNSSGTTLTDTAGQLNVSGSITGSGNLVLDNNTATTSGITLSADSVNNTGTITNSGTGSGSVLISGGVGSGVTAITENSATSALNITTDALAVNASGTTLTNSNASGSSLLTVSGGVTGTGNLVLDNNSSIADGITISGSDLNTTGTVTNSGTGSGSTLISANIDSGVSNVIENGTSTLVLSGINSQTATTVTSGTVQVTANNALGTSGSTVSVASGGALDLDGTDYATASALSLIGTGISSTGALTNSSGTAATYGGVVTIGTGGADIGGTGNITLSLGIGTSANNLTKVGADTLTLDAASSQTGTTTISAGKVQVAANGALGTSAANVVVSGTGAALDLDGTNYSTASALSISGTGVSTTGALTNSSATAATYGGVVTIASGGADIGGSNGTITLSGGFANNANNLTKVGSDTLILTSANSNTGTTTINTSGTIQVGNGGSTGSLGSGGIIDNGILAYDLTSSPTVSNNISGIGALNFLAGNTGTVTLNGTNSYSGATTIASTATVVADSTSAFGTGAGHVTNNGALTIGTTALDLSGSGSEYIQSSTGSLNVTANSASSYGSITTESTSSVSNSSTINVTVGGYIPNGATLEIINASGEGVTGGVPTVTSTNSFLSFVSSVAGGNEYLTANHSSTGFAAAATNPNSAAVGQILDNETNPTSDMLTLLDALQSSTAGQVAAALNTMTPIVDGGVIANSAASLNDFVGAAFEHTQSVLALASTTGVSAGDANPLNNLWAKQYGGYEDQGTRNGIQGYNAWNTGTTVGIDHLFTDNLTLGVSAGYAYGDVDSDINNGNTNINSAQATIYGGYQGTAQPYYVDAAATAAENWYNGRRDVVISNINRVADSQYKGTQTGLYLEGGYKFDLGNNIQLTPLTSLQWTYLSLNSYNETNAGAADLNVNDQSYNTLESGLGASISYPVKLGWANLTPEFHAKWLYDYIDQGMSVTSSFAGGGGEFTTNGTAPARNGADVGGKLTVDLKDDLSVVGAIDTDLRDQFFGITGSVSVQYKF